MKKAVTICFITLFAFACGIGALNLVPITNTSHPIVTKNDSSSSASSVIPSTSTQIPTSKNTQDSTGVTEVESTHYAELPEEEYVAGKVLVMVDNTQDAQMKSAQLGQLAYVADVSTNENDVDAGFITVTLNDSENPGAVADTLTAQGLCAQPNFVYHLLADESTPSSSTSASSGNSLASSSTSTEENETTQASQKSTSHSISSSSNSGSSDDSPIGTQGSVSAQANENQWSLSSISAPSAWESSTGSGVVVAVIDAGCDVTHPDLNNRIAGMYDTVSGKSEASDVADVTDASSTIYSHGTHVAGIIAAEGISGGTSGIAPDATLFIIRALHRSGSSYQANSSDIIAAYQHIITQKNAGMNIRIANMSLGSKRSGTLDSNDAGVMKKIDEAYKNYSILTVTAAGNYDGGVPYKCYPCDFSNNLLGVINLEQSTGSDVKRNTNSNYNLAGTRTKSVSAPGTSITSTIVGGQYATKSGTSMASPCVAGVAALVLSERPELSAEQVANIVCSSTKDLETAGFDVYTGYGEVNASSAVSMAANRQFITGPNTVSKDSSIQLTEYNGSGTWASDSPSIATVSSNGVVTGISQGTASISYGLLKKTITVGGSGVPMYRLYNPYSGEHLFTADSNEYSSLPSYGWRQEGVAWTAPQTGTAPVYRLYNPYSGDHHYTADANEYASLPGAGWRQEGVSFYSDDEKHTPMYRLFNPYASVGTHHYTADAGEYGALPSHGWVQEGTSWYGL